MNTIWNSSLRRLLFTWLRLSCGKWSWVAIISTFRIGQVRSVALIWQIRLRVRNMFPLQKKEKEKRNMFLNPRAALFYKAKLKAPTMSDVLYKLQPPVFPSLEYDCAVHAWKTRPITIHIKGLFTKKNKMI